MLILYVYYNIFLFVISSAWHKEQIVWAISLTKLSNVLPALPVQPLSMKLSLKNLFRC